MTQFDNYYIAMLLAVLLIVSIIICSDEDEKFIFGSEETDTRVCKILLYAATVLVVVGLFIFSI